MTPLEVEPDPAAPVFAEPWQAEAFAMVLHLQATGAFTRTEWMEALSREIAAAGEQGTGERYYEYLLAALEGLAIGQGLAAPDALAARKAAWAEAYRRTPHGQPVSLP